MPLSGSPPHPTDLWGVVLGTGNVHKLPAESNAQLGMSASDSGGLGRNMRKPRQQPWDICLPNDLQAAGTNHVMTKGREERSLSWRQLLADGLWGGF